MADIKMDAKTAIEVLKRMLLRPQVRCNGKSTSTLIIDLALVEGIVALEQKVKMEEKNDQT